MMIDGRTILGRISPDDLAGRDAALDRLTAHATGTGRLDVISAPYAGRSEVLRQAYDLIFAAGGSTMPFYFRFKDGESIRQIAARFLHEFIAQATAFRLRRPELLRSAPDLCELRDAAATEDRDWIESLVNSPECGSRYDDKRAYVRAALSAPLRAADAGLHAVLLIDRVHLSIHSPSVQYVVRQLNEIYSYSGLPFVFAGLRRGRVQPAAERSIHLERLSFADSGELVSRLASQRNVPVNEQTRDLLALTLGGCLGFIRDIITSAAENDVPLDNFASVGRLLTEELFGGRIGKRLDADIRRIAGGRSMALAVARSIENIPAAGLVGLREFAADNCRSEDERSRLLDRLELFEIAARTGSSVKSEEMPIVCRDHLRIFAKLNNAQPRATVVGSEIAANIRRAPAIMAAHYRRTNSLPLRDVVAAFDGREIAAELFGIADAASKLKLPTIVYTAHTAAMYPPIGELIAPERSAVGIGFDDRELSKETAWLVAQIDSKLAATRDKAAYWCDRLEMAAINASLANYKLWLIAPEGFDDDALAALSERGAHGSSFAQFDMIAGSLALAADEKKPRAADEYEIVLPMGSDTEMIAVHAVEDIARRHHVPQKAINQIKTALVEASINAAEHSQSPDRRMVQRLLIGSGRVTLTISNRGVRLADNLPDPNAPASTRRGWGLQLIRGLMDEVILDPVDDGTSITMIKNFIPDDAVE